MKTVLVADDDRNIRSTLTTTLDLEGFAVQTAENGRRALEVVARGGIDLVLLDLQMPELDGIDTLRELRVRGHDLPVVFLTGHASIERAVEAVKLGAFDFIEKPPHAEKILLAVKNALRREAPRSSAFRSSKASQRPVRRRSRSSMSHAPTVWSRMLRHIYVGITVLRSTSRIAVSRAIKERRS